MNQQRVNKLASEQYHGKHKEHADKPEVKAAVKRIIAEEKAKKLDETQTLRGIRTRVSELLQSLTEVPNPEMKLTKSPNEMRTMLDEHHNHQTAHFQALWQHVDALVAEGMASS